MKPIKKHKNIIKLCNLVMAALNSRKKIRLQQVQDAMAEFVVKSMEITKKSNLFSRAIEKGWYDGAESIASKINVSLDNFSYYIQRLKDLLKIDAKMAVRFSDIFAELVQVEQEFNEIRFDSEENCLAVTTSPITLEGLPLGPFEVRLFIDQISSFTTDSPYSVIALEPNPASSDECVTHPHVSSEKLCEGDGHFPIRMAILQGRFFDFFTMVMNILNTYNPESPYVSLDGWDGFPCYDCGCSIGSEESYFCEDCEHDFCCECSTYCQVCESTICLNCSYICNGCQRNICRRCMSVCSDCEETFCSDCLNGDGFCKRCETCQNERKENDNEKNNQKLQGQAGTSVYSDGLGQDAVHA